MIKLSANLSFLFNEVPFKKKFKEASKVGFKAVEFLFPYEYNVNEIKELLDENKLSLVLFNTHPGEWEKGERGLASVLKRENEFKENFYKTVEYAKILNCPNIHIMAGINSNKNDTIKCRDVYLKNLFFCANIAEENNFNVLIEPINNIDIPDYHLNYVSDAIDIIKEINHPALKLQLDLYHAQIMTGNLSRLINKALPYTKHIQIASPPGRNEPNEGEVNYPFLFNTISDSQYEGYIGCEYNPLKNTKDSLKWAKNYGINII